MYTAGAQKGGSKISHILSRAAELTVIPIEVAHNDGNTSRAERIRTSTLSLKMKSRKYERRYCVSHKNDHSPNSREERKGRRPDSEIRPCALFESVAACVVGEEGEKSWSKEVERKRAQEMNTPAPFPAILPRARVCQEGGRGHQSAARHRLEDRYRVPLTPEICGP